MLLVGFFRELAPDRMQPLNGLTLEMTYWIKIHAIPFNRKNSKHFERIIYPMNDNGFR